MSDMPARSPDAPSKALTNADLYLSKAMAARTAQAREEMARKLYDRGAVLAAMEKRAALGWSFLRLEPELPLTLRETAAARALETWLNREGFAFRWIYSLPQDPKRSHLCAGAEKYDVLCIGW